MDILEHRKELHALYGHDIFTKAALGLKKNFWGMVDVLFPEVIGSLPFE